MRLDTRCLSTELADSPPAIGLSGAAGARVVDRDLPVAGAAEAFDASGRLRDHDLSLELESVLAELLDEVRQRERLAVS